MNREIMALARDGNWGRARFQVVEFYICRLGGGRTEQPLLLQHPGQSNPADAKGVAMRKSRRVESSYAGAAPDWALDQSQSKVFDVT